MKPFLSSLVIALTLLLLMCECRATATVHESCTPGLVALNWSLKEMSDVSSCQS